MSSLALSKSRFRLLVLFKESHLDRAWKCEMNIIHLFQCMGECRFEDSGFSKNAAQASFIAMVRYSLNKPDLLIVSWIIKWIRSCIRRKSSAVDWRPIRDRFINAWMAFDNSKSELINATNEVKVTSANEGGVIVTGGVMDTDGCARCRLQVRFKRFIRRGFSAGGFTSGRLSPDSIGEDFHVGRVRAPDVMIFIGMHSASKNERTLRSVSASGDTRLSSSN